jgi:CheY-like chemotaxis protein
VTLPDGPLWVEADLVRLAQVFSNLLNNAAKYTPEGGHIALTATAEGERVVVRVVDDGIGLAAGDLDAIFEMFGQIGGTRVRAQGGLGIGLALARRLTEMHGGTLTASSAGPGHGATFTVAIPRTRDPRGDTAEVSSAPSTRVLPDRRRILIVEDNVDGAESLALLLSLSGHEVRIAHTGQAGLAAAREFEPGVIFLDIGLPDIDGCDVARELRADARSAGATLIALTGWGGSEDRERTESAGFDHHLTKPVEPAHIDAVLASLRPRQA